MADMYAKRIKAKGSLDPENEVRVDRKSVRYSWAQFGVLARMTICKEAGVSLFSARRSEFPEHHAEKLYKVLSEAT